MRRNEGICEYTCNKDEMEKELFLMDGPPPARITFVYLLIEFSLVGVGATFGEIWKLEARVSSVGS